MLQGTKLQPQDVLMVMEPGFGLATVEKIAINAVMAGCRPGSGVGCSSLRRADRVWMGGAMRVQDRLAGAGLGYSSGYLPWIWLRTPCVNAARSGS